MLDKCDYWKYVPVALVLILASAPAVSQVWGNTAAQELAAAEEDHQRFEAERRRQEQLHIEADRRKQEAMRFETERLRQENERREQERLRLENERLRQEIERYKQQRLRIEDERMGREVAEAAAARKYAERGGATAAPDVFEQLRTIGQLRDQGILTELEFQRLKKKILE